MSTSKPFVEAVVMEFKPDKEAQQWEGLPVKGFQVLPRIGERIVLNDDDGTGQAYIVVDVSHAPVQDEPPSGGAADVHVVHVGYFVDHKIENIQRKAREISVADRGK